MIRLVGVRYSPSGAQGIQGKVGDTGVTGDTGASGEGGGHLLCFATDQTIGTQGKYMGLGQQGDQHTEVGVIIPFPAGSIVTTFIVKAAKGMSPRSGTAQVFHDDPADDPNGEALSAQCVLPATAAKSVCTLLVGGVLAFQDSLSVFIKADSGAFVGATACVLIEPAL